MNYPSRVDPEALNNSWNQNPGALALHTNSDLNGRVNLVPQRDHRIPAELPPDMLPEQNDAVLEKEKAGPSVEVALDKALSEEGEEEQGPRFRGKRAEIREKTHQRLGAVNRKIAKGAGRLPQPVQRVGRVLAKYARFMGPGFMVAVAYVDPGNYSTDVAAGASYRFRLLCIVLLSNIIAIFLQSLSIELGTVTGLNLAENIKLHCPKWMNIVLWIFAEAAIIATDIAEVIGTAIALFLLLKIPLVAGCAISILDVLIILLLYQPNGGMRGLRLFEVFVMLLVVGVAICFCVELSLIKVPNVGEIFRGFLPSAAVVQSQGLYQSCGILGATVMPHSLYLGSGIVQPRLKEYDTKHGLIPARTGADDEEIKYKPSLAAIRSCMWWSIAELAISLCTFALFVNSAILIVAGAALSDQPNASTATLFTIHDLFAHTLAPFAGTVFALALLLSGTSAGIICTIAGQMVSEGQLSWSPRPWIRRLVTRSISIVPSIIVAGAVGGQGVSNALNGTQFALSVVLPFTSAPLIYFTCRNRYMTVQDGSEHGVKMGNGWVVAGIGALLWGLITVMNVAAIVLAAMGKS